MVRYKPARLVLPFPGSEFLPFPAPSPPSPTPRGLFSVLPAGVSRARLRIVKIVPVGMRPVDTIYSDRYKFARRRAPPPPFPPPSLPPWKLFNFTRFSNLSRALRDGGGLVISPPPPPVPSRPVGAAGNLLALRARRKSPLTKQRTRGEGRGDVEEGERRERRGRGWWCVQGAHV